MPAALDADSKLDQARLRIAELEADAVRRKPSADLGDLLTQLLSRPARDFVSLDIIATPLDDPVGLDKDELTLYSGCCAGRRCVTQSLSALLHGLLGDVKMKNCPRCGPTPVTSFGPNRCNPDGLAHHCLPCARSIKRAWKARRKNKAGSQLSHAEQESLQRERLRQERIVEAGADRGTA